MCLLSSGSREVRYLLYTIPTETKGMLHTAASQDVVATVGCLLAPAAAGNQT